MEVVFVHVGWSDAVSILVWAKRDYSAHLAHLEWNSSDNSKNDSSYKYSCSNKGMFLTFHLPFQEMEHLKQVLVAPAQFPRRNGVEAHLKQNLWEKMLRELDRAPN
jgi:hypothetical protein